MQVLLAMEQLSPFEWWPVFILMPRLKLLVVECISVTCYGAIISIRVVARVYFNATFEASGRSQVFIDAYLSHVSDLSYMNFVLSFALVLLYYSFLRTGW